jgi:DNA-binding transcriptional regulator YdaS (Cro superfamily)
MSATEAFKSAIKELGGQQAAAELLGRKQPTISGYVTEGNAPADICMRLEVATQGRYRAEDMRPDLADVFKRFRRSRPNKRTAA